jgi:hypothetical protein
MPKAKCNFRGTDVARVIKAVEKATGKPVGRVEVDAGKIIVFPGGDTKPDTALIKNEWDEAAE